MPPFLPRVGASIRSRSSFISTPRISCSFWGEPSTASTRSSASASASVVWALIPTSASPRVRGIRRAARAGASRRPQSFRAHPRIRGPYSVISSVRELDEDDRAHSDRAQERARQAVSTHVRFRQRRARLRRRRAPCHRQARDRTWYRSAWIALHLRERAPGYDVRIAPQLR